MSVAQFAAVLAVHPGTVHRWESAELQAVPVDGVAANILIALDQRSEKQPGFQASRVGDEVIQALVIGGALLALGLLIGHLVGSERK